ncbi:MAG TPA: MFS transporter [bacterium]|nr:MFS transporter [bacterium]
MKKAMMVVLLLGTVSLCGDVVYEGARAVAGPFLYSLGATAAAVGFVSGFGEFAGYGFRIVSGHFVDRTSRYWLLVFVGYAMIVAIPLLAFAKHWQLAALLLVLERTGKAIRTPSREVIISNAGASMGRGWAFGLHEAMDQLGALVGPLIFTAAVALGDGYRSGFRIMVIPFVVMLVVLVVARSKFPEPHKVEVEPEATGQGVSRAFWLYLIFTGIAICGFANFQLVSYHAKAKSLLSDVAIPLMYAVAMGVDGVAALVVGKLYDKRGFSALMALPAIGIIGAPMLFSLSRPAIIVGIILWGIAIGIQETIMRAAVGDLVPLKRRGWAYGTFYAVFGVSWFLGSLVIGFLYGHSIAAVIAFSILLQAASIPAFMIFRREIARSKVQRN